MDLGTHNQWIKELSKYLPNQSNKDIIKYSLAYTLQSFRNKEDMERFKWKIGGEMSKFCRFIEKYINENNLYEQINEQHMTYLEIYEKVIEPNDNVLRSREEYQEKAETLMESIKSQYGEHLLRIYAYYPLIHTKGYNGFDMEELYHNALLDMNKSIQMALKIYKIEDKKDKEMFEIIFKEVFDEQYGYIRPSMKLKILLKLMYDNFNEKEYCKYLEVDLKKELNKQNDKYFINKDLCDKENFLELYKTVGEQMGFTEYRKGIFTKYDGYGKVVMC